MIQYYDLSFYGDKQSITQNWLERKVVSSPKTLKLKMFDKYFSISKS